MDEDFTEQGTDVPNLLMGARIGQIPAGVGHIADDAQHLKQTPVHVGSLLLRDRIVPHCGQREETFCGNHDIGQRFPQFPGGQRHGLKLPVVRVLFQTEHVELLHPCDGRADGCPGNGQIEIKTAAGKCGILLRAGLQDGVDSGARFNQMSGSGWIHFCDHTIFDAESGAGDQIQHPHCICKFFHDVPPHGGSLCKIRENLRIRFQRKVPRVLILAKEKENSKGKTNER